MKKTMLFAAATASFLGLAPAAFAGEGGIAGSASFILDLDGAVVDVAVASAIGKTSAYAGAIADESSNRAFAGGSGGEIDIDGFFIDDLEEESRGGLGTAQANTISAISIGPVQLTDGLPFPSPPLSPPNN